LIYSEFIQYTKKTLELSSKVSLFRTQNPPIRRVLRNYNLVSYSASFMAAAIAPEASK
jgi:hypothetical protein